MVTQEKEQYGNWCRVGGMLEEVGDTIEEAKLHLLKHAQQAMEEKGLELDIDSVEWIIRQQYNDDKSDPTFQLFSDNPFTGSEPYVTVAWKGYAHG